MYTNSTKKNNSHGTIENNSKRSVNLKSVVRVGVTIIKHLNDWKMAKKIKSNCQIFVKSFPRTTVSCMVDYMKRP